MNSMLKRRLGYILMAIAVLLNVVIVIPPATVHAANTTYYVDSVSGNDANNGTSQSTAWRSIAKVNSMVFQPGDKILFKAGGTWVCDTANNALKPQGSGTAASPIVIDMYGTGTKPLIQGPGTNGSCAVYLANQQYWEINNLQVTNPGPTTGGERRRGIFVTAWASNFPGATQSSPAVLSHIYIRNCEVKNVNSVVSGMGNYDKYWGGIIFNMISSSSDTSWARFNDIRIEKNYIHDVGRGGIFVYTDFCTEVPFTAGEGTRPRFPATGVAVRNNYVADTGGDAIVLVGCDAPIMEYNIVARPQRFVASGLYAVGMWPFACYDAVMQYNESFGNQTLNDGQGYDIDYANKRTIVQYNYSHDNQGGFILICSGPGSNADGVVRYNISQNDGGLAGSRIFQVTGARTSNVQIYNNTIYTATNVSKIVASGTGEWEGAPASVTYKNNIIYSRNPGAIFETTGSTSFVNNNFYGCPVPSNSTGHITSDPLFVSPGTGTTGGRIDIGGTRGNVDGYKLQSSSPCINKGVSITNNGGKDYWGNALYNGSPDIGAFETTTGGTTPPPTPTGAAIPGQIEAESYSAMNGIQTETCNEGGSNVGWIDAGDWMDYSVNVQAAGTYKVEFRVAGVNPTGTLQLQKSGTTLATVTPINTGDWQTWTTVSANATLSAGSQTLRVYSTGSAVNLNWIRFSTTTSSPSQVATPTFSPAGGTYTSAQNVTISCATAGATIRYTTDGTTPTTSSPIYSGPISVTSTKTIKALATASGMTNSAIASATFTISTSTGGSLTKTTWYLYNNAVSGVTPAGQNLQTATSGTAGWQPIKTINTTANYWYSPTLTGTYTSGTWSLVLWTNAPGAASNVQVTLYKVNADGTGATQIGTSQTIDINATGGGNHTSTFNFSSIPSVSLSNQRIMVKIVKTSGADATMCYNANDFPTRLVTP